MALGDVNVAETSLHTVANCEYKASGVGAKMEQLKTLKDFHLKVKAIIWL